MKNSIKKEMTNECLMTLAELKNGLHMIDIVCLDDIDIQPFTGKFLVQVQHDGHVQMNEIHNS